MRPALPVYAHVIDRAMESQILGHVVWVSSAEGLVVMKLIAGRPLDDSDVQDLLAAYPGQLDLGFIRSELDSVMEHDDARRVKFESWIRNVPGRVS